MQQTTHFTECYTYFFSAIVQSVRRQRSRSTTVAVQKLLSRAELCGYPNLHFKNIIHGYVYHITAYLAISPPLRLAPARFCCRYRHLEG